MITIWGRTNSHNVKEVLWLAEELGLDFVRHDVGGAFGYPDDYISKNPNRLVPTLEDGDHIIQAIYRLGVQRALEYEALLTDQRVDDLRDAVQLF